MSAPVSYLLCEGYLDRAFLAGWLEHLGCTAAKGVRDPYGDIVSGGRFAFWTPGRHFIVVQPVEGESMLDTAAEELLRVQPTRPMRRLVVVRDADADAPGGESVARDRSAGQVERAGRFLETLGVERARLPAVESFCWWCEDPPDTPGVPPKQTLERLLCGALSEQGADRGRSVSEWLAAPPAGDGPTHKNVAMAWFAKFTDAESQDWFYRGIWGVEPLRQPLRRRLERSGAWEVVHRLVEGA